MPDSYDPQLTARHQELLKQSGISPEIAQARGYTSVAKASDLGKYGLAPRQRRYVPALLIPLYDRHGRQVVFATHPDIPRYEGKRLIEYELPREAGAVLDSSPMALTDILAVQVPLYVTDRVLDADAAASSGLCAVTILGLASWAIGAVRRSVADAKLFHGIPLSGREVFIALANDAEDRTPGMIDALKDELEKAGASVSVVAIPRALGVGAGLAVVVANGGDAQHLSKLIVEHVPKSVPKASTLQYSAGLEGTIWRKGTPHGVEEVLLANFTARIEREILADDGVERSLTFELVVEIGSARTTIQVPSSRFSAMTWPIEKLGSQAIVTHAGQQHLRLAIQSLSAGATRITVFRATGWTETTEYGWVFIHGAGAIGKGGHIDEIKVDLPDALSLYELPAPPSAEVTVERIRETLALLDVIAHEVIVPILSATFRAVLGSVDVSLFVSGPTGVGKSEIVALAEQHFGKGMNARHLPGSWSSTANALEEQSFLARDVVFVVDDFIATDPTQAARLNSAADRLLRAQGNRSGRQRMNDGAVRPARPPRGLIVSTGEDVPRGQSLNARILHVPVTHADLRLEDLTSAQEQAAKGDFAEGMASFIAWLAARRGSINVRQRADILRKDVSAGHARTRDAAANVAVGLQVWLEFARECGALSDSEKEDLWQHGWSTLRQLAESQSEFQSTQEPTERFVGLLRSALASGEAHVANTNGETPDDPARWGYRAIFSGYAPMPKGERIGWTDGNGLFLDPTAAHSLAYRVAASSGEPFTISQTMLRHLLDQRGWLVDREKNRSVYTVRRTVEGVRREVLYLHAGRFWNADAQPVIAHGAGAAIPTNTTNDVPVGLVGPGDGGASTDEKNNERQSAQSQHERQETGPGATTEDEQ